MEPTSNQKLNSSSSRIFKSTLCFFIPTAIASQISAVRSLRQRVAQTVIGSLRRPRSTSTSSSITSETASTFSWSGICTSEHQFDTRLDAALTPITESCARSASVQIIGAGGIDWQAAEIGAKILTDALNRSQHNNTNMSPAMLRTMYVDALKYLHVGLPEDLSDYELRSIGPTASYVFNRATIGDAVVYQTPASTSNKHQNYVRSSTANVVFYLITFVMLGIPILTSLLNKLLEHEKQNRTGGRIVQSALQSTSDLIKSVGTASSTIGGNTVKLTRSPLGTYCFLRCAWLLQSIAQGFSDGVEETLRLKREKTAGPADWRALDRAGQAQR